jgi:hypothetical protein
MAGNTDMRSSKVKVVREPGQELVGEKRLRSNQSVLLLLLCYKCMFVAMPAVNGESVSLVTVAVL